MDTQNTRIAQPTSVEKDPVCGMTVDPARAKATHEHAGKTYYFCCAGCMEKFKVDPQKYLICGLQVEPAPHRKRSSALLRCQHIPCRLRPPLLLQLPPCGGAPKSPATISQRSGSQRAGRCKRIHLPDGSGSAPAGARRLSQVRDGAGAGGSRVPATKTEYTCPMHPEIVRDEPGTCPICGMALEPRTVSAAEEKNPELVDMTRRFWISAALTIPVLLVAMAELVPGFASLMQRASPRAWQWFELILATPVVLWGGWPFFVRGWRSSSTAT